MTTAVIKPSFAAGELRPDLHARVDFDRWNTGLAVCRNFTIRATGGAANRTGTRFLAVGHDQTKAIRLLPFVFNDDDTYLLEFGHLYMRVLRGGQLVVYPAGHAQAGQVVAVVTAYADTDLAALKFDQSGDRIRFTHRGHPAKVLERHDHHDWRWSDEDFAPGIAAPTGLSITSSGTARKYVVTATSKDTGEESLPSAEIGAAGTHETISWTTDAAASGWDVYVYDNGLWGWIGRTETNSFKDDFIDPDTSTTPPKARNPFADGNNPLCLTEHQQRMVYGGGVKKPEAIEGSRTGAYANFMASTPKKADDAYSHSLGRGKVYEIRHLISLTSLIALTAGSVWQVTGTEGTNDAVTPLSVRGRRMSSRGASHVPPLVIGETALYVQARGHTVWDLNYSLEIDGYAGSNMSVLASHLFRRRTIREWAYAEEPDSLIWVVMSDGALLSLAYLREHKVIAWSRHDTDGAYESVCTLPEGDEDAVYFVVRRQVGGQAVRYLERLETRVSGLIEEAWFVDCGLRYDGAPAATVSGLGHLEGKTAVALADGNVVKGLTISGGAVTLPRPASMVLVGLPYSSELMTLGVNYDTRSGSVQGRGITIPGVVLKVEESRGGKVGPSLDRSKMVEIKSAVVADAANQAFSGDIVQRMAPGWSTRGQVAVAQDDPLPFTLLAMVPTLEASGG